MNTKKILSNKNILEPEKEQTSDILQGSRSNVKPIDDSISGDIRDDIIGAIEQDSSKIDESNNSFKEQKINNKNNKQSNTKKVIALCKLNIRQKKAKDSNVVKVIRVNESFNIKDNDTIWYDVIENGKTIGYLLKMDDTIK